MSVSVFDIFRVGIGPSSSHTVGPMRAAARFSKELIAKGLTQKTARIWVDLMGSLGATGVGHATDTAFQLGLMGMLPANVDLDLAPKILQAIKTEHQLKLPDGTVIEFDSDKDIILSPEKVAIYHTNAMHVIAQDKDGQVLLSRRYYSVGGGFIVESDPDNFDKVSEDKETVHTKPQPYPVNSAADLLKWCRETGLSIPQIVRANEKVWWETDEKINAQLDYLWSVMKDCVARGLKNEGIMPGPMKVRRRAKQMYEKLDYEHRTLNDPLAVLDWVNAFAFAANEENACGGRVVTAPTNGAAGVIPAVLHYYMKFIDSADINGVRDFLLTAGQIGILYKENASISGAEVGCQGEVGVACSMASGGLAQVLGATPEQVENAAEIGMEHHLGMTCDPVAGQVQIPCIERNAVAAVKAINAARLALMGDGHHYVSLDQVIVTMLKTGLDLQMKYKETSRGGLAVSVVEC